MATVNDTDTFLVNRSNSSYQIEAQNMAELLDTDLMLVNRGGVSYKATGEEIKDSLGPKGFPNKPSIVAPADGAGIAVAAESDEIIDISGGPITIWSEASTMYGDKSDCFNGETGNSNGGIDTSKRTVVGLPLEITYSLSYYSTNTIGQDSTWTFTRTDGAVANTTLASGAKVNNGWTYVPLPDWELPFTVNKVEAQRSSSSEKVAAVRVDGSGQTDSGFILTDYAEEPILTFSGNKGITGSVVFTPGDSIQQDSGHTPVTSAINNISSQDLIITNARDGQTEIAMQTAYSKGVNFSTAINPDGSIKSSYSTFGSELYCTSAPKIVYSPPIDTSSTNTINAYGGCFNNSPRTYTVTVTYTDGSTDSYTESSGLDDWLSTKKFSTVGKFVLSVEVSDTGFSMLLGITLGDNAFVTQGTRLSLSSNQDLANFRVGDEVYKPTGVVAPSITRMTFSSASTATPFAANQTSYISGDPIWEAPNELLNSNDMYTDPVRSVNYSNWGAFHGDTTYGIAPLTIYYKDAVPGTVYYLKLNQYSGTNNQSVSISGNARFGTSFASNITTINEPLNNRDDVNSFLQPIVFDQATGEFVVTKNGPAAYINIRGIIGFGVPKDIISLIVGSSIVVSSTHNTWTVGDVVTGPDTIPATATISTLNTFNSTMTLFNSAQDLPNRWIVNQGKFVKGQSKLSPDSAPQAAGLTLFSSAFSSTPEGAVGQSGADWQVAAYDDINFSNPISEDLNSSTALTQWPVVPELAADTQYRCRVRHASVDLSSQWSDASTFKTAETFDYNATPGYIYKFKASNSTVQKSQIRPPTLIVQAVRIYGDTMMALLGVNGKVYFDKADTASPSEVIFAESGNVKGIACGSNRGVFMLCNNKEVWFVDYDNPTPVPLVGQISGRPSFITTNGSGSRVIEIMYSDNQIQYYNSGSALEHTETINWPVPIVQLACPSIYDFNLGYKPHYLVGLDADGKLIQWITPYGTEEGGSPLLVPGFSKVGTPEFPAHIFTGETFTQIACYDRQGVAMSAVNTSGQLWFGADSRISFNGLPRNFSGAGAIPTTLSCAIAERDAKAILFINGEGKVSKYDGSGISELGSVPGSSSIFGTPGMQVQLVNGNTNEIYMIGTEDI